MKDLSSGSGVAEPFQCLSAFRFQTLADARLVEKSVHAELTERGLRKNPRREFFVNTFSFHDVVRRHANKLDVITLSEQHILTMFQDFGLAVPCAYFLLTGRDELDKFQGHLESFYELLTYTNGYSGSTKLLPFVVGANSYPIEDMLENYWREPYYVARAKTYSLALRSHSQEQYEELMVIIEALEDNCSNKMDELFGLRD